jgi:hypothetical protein
MHLCYHLFVEKYLADKVSDVTFCQMAQIKWEEFLILTTYFITTIILSSIQPVDT